tara:strand:- start:17319 stop:17492 length:174 start_codon:yes stop_codon:yes gene_type:complete
MVNKKMLITDVIDKIAKLAVKSEDLEVIVSSTAALKTLDILQKLGFKHISVDQYADV